MAIAYDATAGATNSGTTSLTYSHTCTGSNLILFVGVADNSNAAAGSTTGVTYNGSAMTLVTSRAASGGKNYLFYLVNPSTGSNSVVITRSNGTNTLVGLSTSYTGAAQTGQPDSFGTAQGASPLTASTTVVASGCWLVGFASDIGNGGNSQTSSQTSRNANAGGSIISDTNTTVGTGSQTLTDTWSGSIGPSFVIASFSPVASPFTAYRTLMGVGI